MAAAIRPKSTRALTASRYVFIAMAKTLPNIFGGQLSRLPAPFARSRRLEGLLRTAENGQLPTHELRNGEQSRADALFEKVTNEARSDVDEHSVGEEDV